MNTFWKLIAVVLFVNAASGQDISGFLRPYIKDECNKNNDIPIGLIACQKCIQKVAEPNDYSPTVFMQSVCKKKSDADKCLTTLKGTFDKCMKTAYKETGTVLGDLADHFLDYVCSLSGREMSYHFFSYQGCAHITADGFGKCIVDNATAADPQECMCDAVNNVQWCLKRPVISETTFTKYVIRAGDYIRKNFFTTDKFKCQSGSSQMSHISLLGILMTAVLAAFTKFFHLN